MTAAELVIAGGTGDRSLEFTHVLTGIALEADAARLAGMLDPRFLVEAGWNPQTRMLSLPAQYRLLGRTVSRVYRCHNTVHSASAVCHRCFTRLSRLGMSPEDIATAIELPDEPAPATRCAVPECRCVPTVRLAVLCEPHAKKFRLRRPRLSMEQFLADPRVGPLPPTPACQVAACIRTADGACGYCNTHYQRLRERAAGSPGPAAARMGHRSTEHRRDLLRGLSERDSPPAASIE